MIDPSFQVGALTGAFVPPCATVMNGVPEMSRAFSVFDRLRRRAQLRSLAGRLIYRPRRLLCLRDAVRGQVIESMHDGGLASVAIRDIRGSECRFRDFDDEFVPLRPALRPRWVGLYAARRVGVPLPAVSLVWVGGCYYVRDGHHRVSVARALGEAFIDAQVQVWELCGCPERVTARRAGRTLAPGPA